MCKFKLFTIVAAALMMAACSTEDITQQPKTGEMQFTATIAAPNKGGTRTAYTVDGTDIKVAWKVGDEIALVHNYVKDVATVKSVDATTGQATISGIITGTPADGDAVKLIYPAAYISGVNDEFPTMPTMDEGYYNLLFAQDGTLDYIQNNIDFRHNDNGKLSVTETGVTLKSTVIMESSIAIWKLTLQDDAATPAALAATKVTIKGKFTSEGQDEDLASTTELSPGASTVYLAVPADGTSANICITAATADNDYFYMKEGVALATGKYYQSTVQMTKGAHLAFLSADYEAKDGAILTGTLNGAQKITIADGATVTLDGVTINGVHSDWYQYAGITCLGDATIILKDGTTNTVTGFDGAFPGIQGAAGKTLTITGTGSLNAASGGTGAGIGSGAYSNNYAERACGDIVIEGGTITATGGSSAAGIGSGYEGSCGDITITTGVTQVTATRDGGFETVGSGGNGRCGTVTIGCTLNSDGNPIGGTTGAISTSPYTYDPSNVSPLANVTSADLGKVVCAAGHLHDAKTAVPSGCTAVGILGKVTATGKGLILALQDATSQTWNTINGWTSVTTYAGTTLKQLPAGALGTNLTSYTTLGSTTVSNWCVAQKSDYVAIFTNLGSTINDNGYTYDDNVNAYITTGVGGTAISGVYWSATVNETDNYYAWNFGSLDWGRGTKGTSRNLRPVLGF